MDAGRCCAIGVMAKAPQAGRSKTRLCPPLRPEDAASLSAAFLRDITENIALAGRFAPTQGCVAYAPVGAEALFDGHLAAGTGFVLADGSVQAPPGVEGFGRCLLQAVQAMLGHGYGAACVLNSDSPTLPTAVLAKAAQSLLAPGDRIVLGPAEDGGYYLLGMKAAYSEMFSDIAWSTDDVAGATRRRAASLGLEVVELATWYDVDDGAALDRLLRDTGGVAATALHPYGAPFTVACLERLGLRHSDRSWGSAPNPAPPSSIGVAPRGASTSRGVPKGDGPLVGPGQSLGLGRLV